ncbi:MAG: hypothetical protein QOF62_1007 [Pyrinomonadaceae bacterium]|jgi:hypothetical protein|nr:hypothetical protein [Pyrinomonadaceae bacterium]
MNSRKSNPGLKSLSLILCVASLALAQTQKKTVEWTPRPIGSNNERVAPGIRLYPQIEQIQIENVVIDGASITLGQSFPANDDWLKTLIIRVRNVSPQRVISIQMTLILPEMDHASPDIVYCYGCARADKEKGVGPGEIVELKLLGGGFYDWVKSRTEEKGGIALMAKAQIRETLVTLPDGTRWLSGCVKTADAKNACPRPAP